MKRELAHKLMTAAALLLAVLFSVGCAVSDKEYSAEGITIKLPSDFKTYDAEDFDVCYESNDCAVFALKESFNEGEGFGSLSLREYTQLVLEANELSAEINEDEGFDYFEFEKFVEDSEEPYEYLACCYRADGAFWLVQFSCADSDYDGYKPRMLEWARSVRFYEPAE